MKAFTSIPITTERFVAPIGALAALAAVTAALVQPRAAISGLGLMLVLAALVRRPLTTLIALPVATLIFLGRPASVFPGNFPLVDASVFVAAIFVWPHIRASLRENRGLRFCLAAWLVWIVLTLIKLPSGIRDNGALALRDALIAFEFGAIFVAAGVWRLRSSETRAAVNGLLGLAAFLAPLYLLRNHLPVELFQFSNVGVAGCAMLAAGLASRRLLPRAVLGAAALAAITLSQARMTYLAAFAVLACWAAFRTRRRSGAAPAAGLALLLGLFLLASPLLPQTEGRLGAVSISAIGQQLSSLVRDEGVLSGSISDRRIWWSDRVDRWERNPSLLLTGEGLGSDLLGGFRDPAGNLVRKPHNDYLEASARLGLLGGLALLLISLFGISRVPRLMGSGELWHAGLAGWLIAAAMTAMAQPYFAYAHGAVTTAAAIGLAASVRQTRDRTT